jgi:hypothetical protein
MPDHPPWPVVLTPDGDSEIRVSPRRARLATVVRAFDAGARPEEIVRQHDTRDLLASKRGDPTVGDLVATSGSD